MHWTKAELDRALDDVRGHALPHKEQADDFLHADEQEKRGQWIYECQRMTQNAISPPNTLAKALAWVGGDVRGEVWFGSFFKRHVDL